LNEALNKNSFSSVYEDHLHKLWIGTRSGLNKLQIPQKKITHIKKIPDAPQ